MKRSSLVAHKKELKILDAAPEFTPAKRNKLPKPLHTIGGPRVQVTKLISVSDGYSAWFMWKDGETIEETAFYGFLFANVGQKGNLYPLCHMHWHPSHKLLHIKTPCDSDLDYTNRGLPGAKELHVNGGEKRFDPRIEQDRLQLVEIFCEICGIRFGSGPLL